MKIFTKSNPKVQKEGSKKDFKSFLKDKKKVKAEPKVKDDVAVPET